MSVRVFCLLAAGWCAAVARQSGEDRWFAVSAGMGANILAAPSVVDYVNIVGQPGFNDRVGEFTSSFEFFLSPELQVSDWWSVGIEYNYMIKSYSVTGSGGASNFTYTTQMPGVVVHYLIPAEGYGFKLGGGLAYVAGNFSEALYGSGRGVDYRTSGGSLKLEAIGVTKFDDSFYGTIAFDLRWVSGGVFRNSVRELRVGGTSASLDSFSAGFKLGVEFLW